MIGTCRATSAMTMLSTLAKIFKNPAALAVLFVSCLNARASEPLAIGSRLEMFVDRHLIDELSGDVHLTLHELRDEGEVLKFDHPWEGQFCIYATVIHDGPKYRLYYRGRAAEEIHPGQRPEVTCYAESADGIHWTKPKLGLFEIHGSKENNVILAGPRPFSHNFCPFLDTNPNAASDRRYKALAGGSDSGLVAFVSANGIRWRKLRDEPVLPWNKEDLGLDSQNLAFWSEQEKQYVMYYRHTIVQEDGEYLRSIARATSSDFVNWRQRGLMTYSDTESTSPSVQLYTNQTSPYFRAPHIYLSTAARFMPGRKVLTDEQAKQISLDPAYIGDTSDAILMTSRGGTRYDRTFLSALIKPGIGLQNWTSRTNFPALNIVQTGDTEMSLCVTQDYAQPTAHLRRYSMRLDGLASLRAAYEGGEMITKPLIFKGKRLLLNFATSAAGGIGVEIQDADGDAIPGFTLADCREIIGNEIERAVVWKERDDLSPLTDKPVRLRFVIKDADLYSLRFK